MDDRSYTCFVISQIGKEDSQERVNADKVLDYLVIQH